MLALTLHYNNTKQVEWVSFGGLCVLWFIFSLPVLLVLSLELQPLFFL